MSDVFEHLIQDNVSGILWRSEGKLVLVAGTVKQPLRGKVIVDGDLWVRYAIPYHGPRHLSVMPTTFVAGQGGMLHGAQAWRFIFKNYQLYPRAEVFGLRSDGDEVQVFLRELDLADTAYVLVYDGERKTIPLGRLERVIIGAGGIIPKRVQQLVPVEREE